tara:strand:- start:134 stop:295 length:162 start_codon:yes stop_codon:yes gene_type:complete
MNKYFTEQQELAVEQVAQPELTLKRRRLEERLEKRKIANEIDYLEDSRDLPLH